MDRSAKSTTDKAHANLEMGTHTKENSSMVFFMGKDSSNGLMELFIRENSKAMRLQVLASINGQMVLLMMD